MKKLFIFALVAITMPAYALTLNLNSDNRPCVKNLNVQKGKVYQISAYDYEYVELSDNTTFHIKNSQGKRLTPVYQREIKAYLVSPINIADGPDILYLTAKKTGRVSSVCLYSGL